MNHQNDLASIDLAGISALYVDVPGIYTRLGCDCWGIDRDARTYDGNNPIVAHPPCESWGKLYAMKPGRRLGDDDGCFQAALAAVERCGGVLEHPEGSAAFLQHGIRPPTAGVGWHKDPIRPGWACQVYQGHYGHQAAKSTWLYYVGDSEPQALVNAPCQGHRSLQGLSSRARRATPLAFALVLLRLAHLAYRSQPADLADRGHRGDLANLAHRGTRADLVDVFTAVRLALPLIEVEEVHA